jgi:hypothetical protein
LVGVTSETGAVSVEGVNPWEHEWISLGGSLDVPHPSYPAQRHQLSIYRVDGPGGAVTFAAGELSNGAWCFYVPS